MKVTGLGVRWGEGCGSLLNMLVLDMWGAEVKPCALVRSLSTGPDQVNLVEVLTYADEVQLKWTPPTRPVGPLTGYSVLCSGNHSLDATATSHICGGLTPNSTYNVSIVAVNMFGKGEPFEKTVKTACECECSLCCFVVAVCLESAPCPVLLLQIKHQK